MVPLPIKTWLSFLMGTAKVVGAANQVHSCFQCLHLPMRLRMYAYLTLACGSANPADPPAPGAPNALGCRPTGRPLFDPGSRCNRRPQLVPAGEVLDIASRTASNPGLTKPAIARFFLLDMTFLLILHHPRTLQDGFFAPFEEIVLHARHTCLTVVSSGFSFSSQEAGGRPLCADDPRVAEGETMRATIRVRPDAQAAWLSEVEHVRQKRTLRPTSHLVLNGLAA